MPFFQEIRDKFANELVEVSLDYTNVVKGTYLETTLAVSHRWMQSEDPDPDGEQLKALKDFLNSPDGKKIERVWIDSACMPQDQPKGSCSEADKKDFQRMLAEVNRLYLGCTVLILLDLSYVSRFWTQFESWLAMQFATPDGLKPAKATENRRHHIVCIQNAASQAELYTKALVDNWADKTPDQAHAFLSKPDVTVTNKSDKDGQLPKIKALDATVKGAFGEIARQQQDELTASEAAAARAEAELTACQATVQQAEAAVLAAREAREATRGALPKIKALGVRKVQAAFSDIIRLLEDEVARAEEAAACAEAEHAQATAEHAQAADAVAAARDAIEKHAQAISSGVIPAMMQWEERPPLAPPPLGPPAQAARSRPSDERMPPPQPQPRSSASFALRRAREGKKDHPRAMVAQGEALEGDRSPPDVSTLVEQLRVGTAGQKENAAAALASAADKAAIAKAGGIPPLVALARDGTEGQKQWAAAALRNLARIDANNVAIARAGGIEPLVALISEGTAGQKQEAAAALVNLACNADSQVAIARAGGIAPLVALARDGTEGHKEEAAAALRNLAANADNKVAITEAGGIAPLVALARGGKGGQKEMATAALANLSKNTTIKAAIKKAGWK